jgi:hypothetical protein
VILKNEVSDFEERKMMNIESKRFKIVSTGHGGYMVTNLATNETKYVSSAPSAQTLAAINEREFDIVMSNLMKGT